MRRFFLLALLLFATPSSAQDEGAVGDRLNRLERDLNFLQRQVYRNAADTTSAPSVGGSQAGYAQLQEQLRQLRGELERVQYENRRLSEELRKITADVDFRLRALEERQQQIASAQAELQAAEAEEPAENTKEEPKKEEEPKKAVTGKDYPNSNEHYNHAFKLIQDKNYSAAATSFDDFVHTYPNDPLTSNAYYWLGESYYARNDFTRSAEAFRKGWEVNPDGQKAPDNLYKLALSLANVKRTNEACVVLQQIIGKYGDAAPTIRDKATAERTTLACK